MPRARNIKPSFFANEDLAELPAITRLLFIGLWTMADREGRMEDRPKRIKMCLFPGDDIDVDQSLSELEKSRFILRYASGESRFIQVLNFKKHQNPHYKEPASTIPAPYLPQASPGQALGKPETSLVPTLLIPDSGFLIPDSGSLISDSEKNPVWKSERFKPEWDRWKKHLIQVNKPLNQIAEEEQLMAVARASTSEDDAIELVRFSVRSQAKNLILNGDHRRKGKEDMTSPDRKTKGQLNVERAGL